MENIIMGIVGVEIFSLLVAYLSSWFFGAANRKDKELRTMRKIMFVVIFLLMNIRIFIIK